MLAYTIAFDFATRRSRAAQGGSGQASAWASASASAFDWGSGAAALLPPRAKYALPEEAVVSAVLSGSERHGLVTKASALPAEFYLASRHQFLDEKMMHLARRGEPAGGLTSCADGAEAVPLLPVQ